MKWLLAPTVPACLLLCPVVLAAFGSIPAHQAQARNCKAAYVRERAVATQTEGRTDAARREEECLADADDGVIPLLLRGTGESVDVPTAVQTYRDSSAGLCGVLAEKGSDIEGPAQARSQCTANREADLAQLVDSYALGGKAPSSVVTGVGPCDDAFKANHAGAHAWATLASCASEQIEAKAALFVPKFADGDPLGALGHSEDQIASTFSVAINAGNGVCDVLIATQPSAKEPMREKCRASVAAAVAKAVLDRLH